MIDKKSREKFEKIFKQRIKGTSEYFPGKEKKSLTNDFRELCQVLHQRYSVSKPSVYQFGSLLELYTKFFKEETYTEFPYSKEDPRPKECKLSGRGYIHCTESIRIKKSKLCDECPENPNLKKKQGPLDEVKRS